MNKKNQKIVTIGGGTGSFMLLSGLKHYPVDLSAIVSMADDGGSTGILRDEMGVLPPGDVRQCLVALSESSKLMRELFNFRYSSGRLKGHNFGNILLATLEKITGNFDKSIKEATKILRVEGQVIPVTLKNIQLIAYLNNGKKIIGQNKIEESNLTGLKKLSLKPIAVANPDAVRAIAEADKIIINPGLLFGSIIPNFLVKGIPEAIKKSKAKKIYVCNLMTQLGHTDNFTAIDFIQELEKYLGKNVFDYVIYNTEKPEERLIKKYSKEGDKFVELGDISKRKGVKFIQDKLLSKEKIKPRKGDMMKRTFIRHDSNKVAKIIYEL